MTRRLFDSRFQGGIAIVGRAMLAGDAELLAKVDDERLVGGGLVSAELVIEVRSHNPPAGGLRRRAIDRNQPTQKRHAIRPARDCDHRRHVAPAFRQPGQRQPTLEQMVESGVASIKRRTNPG
jgi:hypothetical protein